MSSVRSHLDEFESVFRAAVRPHVEIEPLSFDRLLVVIDAEGSDAKREAATACAVNLADRFQVDCRLVAPVAPRKGQPEPDTSQAERLLEQVRGQLEDVRPERVTAQLVVGSPARAILEEVRAFDPSLIVMSSLFGEQDDDLESYTLGSVADRVLSSVSQPILLIEGEVPDPAALWTDLLVYIESAATAGSCLAAALKLAEKGAATTLLHVLDQDWLATMRHGIELASELETDRAEQAIKRSLLTDMEHFLSGAAKALSHTGHRAETHIQVGDPIAATRDRILEKGHKLLVCNSVAPDQKLIDSVAYNLAAYLREIPLLLV